jgi:hypothetical protein
MRAVLACVLLACPIGGTCWGARCTTVAEPTVLREYQDYVARAEDAERQLVAFDVRLPRLLPILTDIGDIGFSRRSPYRRRIQRAARSVRNLFWHSRAAVRAAVKPGCWRSAASIGSRSTAGNAQ